MMTVPHPHGYSPGVFLATFGAGLRGAVGFPRKLGVPVASWQALSGFFTQVLVLCARAGLVRLGHVALDGTQIKANASKHKAMRYAKLVKAETALEAEVQAWLEAAQAADIAEDRPHGATARGDETPNWMADKRKRLEKIRAAKASLEAEAREAAEEKAKRPKKRRGGRRPKTPPGTPKDNTQRSFTDPESLNMKGRGGFVQAYNAQAAVGAAARCSKANPQLLRDKGIRGYVATGRQKNPDGGE